jgi:hypothetical protein
LLFRRTFDAVSWLSVKRDIVRLTSYFSLIGLVLKSLLEVAPVPILVVFIDFRGGTATTVGPGPYLVSFCFRFAIVVDFFISGIFVSVALILVCWSFELG